MSETPSAPSSPAGPGELVDDRLLSLAARLLLPLARLCVAHGVTFAAAEDELKRAFAEASRLELEKAGVTPNMSRISLGSGVHRKDIKRFQTQAETASSDAGARAGPSRRGGRSIASELYTRWTTDPAYLDRGAPRPLVYRSGDGASATFERLARDIGTDTHPRSALEELRRLGLAHVDESSGTVSLVPGGFVPLLARTELLGLLADNTADHLSTAVGNVLGLGPRRLEQSVFDSGLSAESVDALDRAAREIWQDALATLVPLITRLSERDRSERRTADRRVRIGMYSFSETDRT